jgi:hypothetical protein
LNAGIQFSLVKWFFKESRKNGIWHFKYTINGKMPLERIRARQKAAISEKPRITS